MEIREKEFKSKTKELRIVEYDDDKPDIQIEDSLEYGFYLYEFESPEQLQEIISHLQLVYERWE